MRVFYEIKFCCPDETHCFGISKQSLTGRFLTNTNILIPIEVRFVSKKNKVGLSSLYNTVIEESIDDPTYTGFCPR